jgi:rhodanese-related sulfurtransferase
MRDDARVDRPGLWAILILSAAGLMAACGPFAAGPTTEAEPGGDTLAYTNLTADDLHERMSAHDAFLVNVHVPYEGEIPGTDANIPYDQVAEQLSMFPPDRSQPIIVYCRSGNMSEIAARTLLDAGYQQVYNLAGGYRDWVARGYDFQE